MMVIEKLSVLILVVFSCVNAAQSEEYVYCTHGLRKLDDRKMTAYTQSALFRLADLKFKTELGWQYEIECPNGTCDISKSQNSVLIHKKLTEGHEIYLTRFDKPNMEIIIDRTRVTTLMKRSAYVESQCEWFEEK